MSKHHAATVSFKAHGEFVLYSKEAGLTLICRYKSLTSSGNTSKATIHQRPRQSWGKSCKWTLEAEINSFEVPRTLQLINVELSEETTDEYQKFIDRISTFFNEEGINNHWLGKPPSLNPANCAIYGWRLTSINMLTCELCASKLYVEISPKLPQHIARKCLKEIERNLRSSHTKGCAYRFTPCSEQFKLISFKSDTTLIEEFHARLKSLRENLREVPCVSLDDYAKLEQLKTSEPTLKGVPTEMVVLALLGWQHDVTKHSRFSFIKCIYCHRKLCTMFYRKLTQEEEQLAKEAEERIQKERESSSSDGGGSCEGSLLSILPTELNRKRKSSAFLLEAAQIRPKRRPQDSLNPVFEHRSWCIWISKETRESPPGWKVMLEALVSHFKSSSESNDLSTSDSHTTETNECIIEVAENAIERLRRYTQEENGNDEDVSETFDFTLAPGPVLPS